MALYRAAHLARQDEDARGLQGALFRPLHHTPRVTEHIEVATMACDDEVIPSQARINTDDDKGR